LKQKLVVANVWNELCFIMLSVVMLNVVMLSVVMLNVNMLNVVMLNVDMLNVVAPFSIATATNLPPSTVKILI